MLNLPPASVTKRKKEQVLPHIRWETVVGTTSVWEKGGGRQKQSKLFAYNYSTLAALEAIVGVVTYWTIFSGLNWSPLQFIFPLPTCSVWQDFVCSVQAIHV